MLASHNVCVCVCVFVCLFFLMRKQGPASDCMAYGRRAFVWPYICVCVCVCVCTCVCVCVCVPGQLRAFNLPAFVGPLIRSAFLLYFASVFAFCDVVRFSFFFAVTSLTLFFLVSLSLSLSLPLALPLSPSLSLSLSLFSV